jgi:Pyruvate/2-oxoacid:ferredoxin oxidoreductase delta subunit
MGHITSKKYRDLQARLDKHAQGAPESETLYKILQLLFTEEEAGFAAKLPMRFFTIAEAAQRFKLDHEATEKILNNLADKGILLDVENERTRAFALSPTMAGFFEFSLMRTDGKLDRKALSELFYQYINQEEDFVLKVFGMKTTIDRTFVHEDQLKDVSIVLDYEKASHIIEKASCITVGNCYCRHKMSHVGKACDAPQEVCLTLNRTAESLAKHGIARKISKEEAIRIIEKSRESGLVQIGDNIQEGVNWICNCCSCCCEGLLAYKKMGLRNRIQSNFFAQVDDSSCIKCGMCVTRCPVNAINMTDKILIDWEKCIGCGVCSRFCLKKSIEMMRRKKTNFTPKDMFERVVVNAIEEGQLQNYIFDNYDSWTSELLRRLFGIILGLTPRKALLAKKQIRSRYLQALIKTKYYRLFDELYNEGKPQDYSHPEL